MVIKALLLYRELTVKLKSHTPHHVDVLKASISLILFAVAQLKADRRDKVTKTFAALNTILWRWITDRDVIGGSIFGGSLPIKESAMGMWKPKEELDLWQSLLSVKCPSDQHVTEQWHNVANAQIQKRMNGVSILNHRNHCFHLSIYIFKHYNRSLTNGNLILFAYLRNMKTSISF